MHTDLTRIEIYETTELVIWDAPELGPFPEGADRRLFALRENAADAKPEDVG